MDSLDSNASYAATFNRNGKYLIIVDNFDTRTSKKSRDSKRVLFIAVSSGSLALIDLLNPDRACHTRISNSLIPSERAIDVTILLISNTNYKKEKSRPSDFSKINITARFKNISISMCILQI